MKAKLLAALLLLFVTVFVLINAAVLTGKLSAYATEVAAVPAGEADTLARAEDIYRRFRTEEGYISLTVSHDDLSEVRSAFAEWVGAATAGDEVQFTIAKSRLRDALEQLGRLSGIHAESIL